MIASKLHVIAGLPRAGSSLLAGLLRQNPRCHAAVSSPVAGLVTALVNAMAPPGDIAVFLDEPRRLAILRGVLASYYAPQADKAVIFDSNRAWCASVPLLLQLVPDARVICCVRDVAWVLDSFERLTRSHPLWPSRLFANAEERRTVYSRANALAQNHRVLGSAWSAFKEAYYGEHSERLMVIEYDLLTRFPQDALGLIYDFIGEPRFAHDVENVAYEEPALDDAVGLPRMHQVRRRVEHVARETILPPDLFQRFSALTFWRDGSRTRAMGMSVQSSPPHR